MLTIRCPLQLMSTMPGVMFYERHGYSPASGVQLHTFVGVDVELLPMRKTIHAAKEDAST
jgi:hypothetical protein